MNPKTSKHHPKIIQRLFIQLRCRAIPPPRLRQVGCEVDGWICGVVGGPVPTRNLPFWGSRGGSRGVLGRLGGSRGILGEPGVSREAFWTVLGPSWGRLGAVLGELWAILGPSWGRLGPSWAHLGPSWGRLGPSWGSKHTQARGMEGQGKTHRNMLQGLQSSVPPRLKTHCHM